MKLFDMDSARQAESQQDRLGHVIALRLTDSIVDTPEHICERLKVARNRAVARKRSGAGARRLARAPALAHAGASNAVRASSEDSGWGNRWVAALPAIALLAGLFAINTLQSDKRDAEIAEVDTALLTDDLPPTAYADPGFLQFLKWSREQDK